MSDQCGTACALHQHAAHGMPAHCEFADGHLTACSAPLCMPALHGCSASFLLALPLLHMVVVKKEEGEGEGEGAAMCLQKDQHTNVCTHTHWMQSGGCSRVWHTRTHTHTCSWRAPLLPHHNTKKKCGDRHGESVWSWRWCGPLAGMHGVVAITSCTAAQHGFHLCHAKRRE